MSCFDISKLIIRLLKADQYIFGERAFWESIKYLGMRYDECVRFIISSLESGVKLEEKINNEGKYRGKKYWILRNRNDIGIDAYIKMSLVDKDKIYVEIFSAHHEGFDIRKGV